MKKPTVTFKFPNDFENDFENEFNIRCHMVATKVQCSIYDALNIIRARLKHGTGVSKKEQETLEQIRELLNEYYVEG